MLKRLPIRYTFDARAIFVSAHPPCPSAFEGNSFLLWINPDYLGTMDTMTKAMAVSAAKPTTVRMKKATDCFFSPSR